VQDEDWQAEVQLNQRREKNARRILGVSDSADMDEIKRVWRKKSFACHPDRNPGDADSARQFILLNCAYRFFLEGSSCEELDKGELNEDQFAEGKYRRDNLWGYFAWWRETYF